MTVEEALLQLQLTVDLTAAPEITPDEAMNCLAATRRWVDRENSTAYDQGSSRIAVNGRLLKVYRAGTSDASAPASFGALAGPTCYGVIVSDGSTGLLWQDVGPAPASPWDYTAAKRAVYDLRVQRSAVLVASNDGNQSIAAQQMHDHWRAERDRLRRFYAV